MTIEVETSFTSPGGNESGLFAPEMAEALPVGILTWDSSRGILQVNSALCALLDTSEQELLGSSPVAWLHPDEIDKIVGMASVAVRDGVSLRVSSRVMRSDGSAPAIPEITVGVEGRLVAGAAPLAGVLGPGGLLVAPVAEEEHGIGLAVEPGASHRDVARLAHGEFPARVVDHRDPVPRVRSSHGAGLHRP